MKTNLPTPSTDRKKKVDGVSIIIPVYNEEAAIAAVVKEITAVFNASGLANHEIIVVDDGSFDRTAETAESAGATVIRNLQNVGYGFSLKQGIMAARHDTIVITDGDATYPIDEIPNLIKKYNEGYNLIVGARSGPYYRESIIKFPLRVIFKWLVEFTVGRSVHDVNSGLRVFSRREILPYFPHLSNKFSFTTSQTLAYMLNAKFIAYHPIDYKKRVGHSKVRLFRDSLSAMQMIVSAILYFNPLKLFLVLCAGTGIFSIAAFIAWILWGIDNALWLGFAGILITVLIFGMGLLADLLHQKDTGIDVTSGRK